VTLQTLLIVAMGIGATMILVGLFGMWLDNGGQE
jgi:hypothetical protein